jgi:hypothetical protein
MPDHTAVVAARDIPAEPQKRSQAGLELKLVTNMVEALAQKLKKCDSKIQKLQDKADMFNEGSLKLESAKERMGGIEAKNQSLSALFWASQDETDEFHV